MKKIIIILLAFGIAFSSCIYKNEEGDPVIGSCQLTLFRYSFQLPSLTGEGQGRGQK